MKILELENEPLSKLRAIAKGLNIPNANRLKKETLAMMIREAEAQKEGIELRGGILEIMSEGIGFLRATNYRISDQDVYEIYRAEFDKAYEERTLFLLTMHPFVTGHRSRFAALEKLVLYMKSKPGVWFATHEQVAKAAATQLNK